MPSAALALRRDRSNCRSFILSRSRAAKPRRSHGLPSFAFALDDREGIGEATPIERYGESVESVTAVFCNRIRSSATIPFGSKTLLHSGIPAAARAGLDLALHDLIGKELGKPLYALARARSGDARRDLVYDRHRRSAANDARKSPKSPMRRFSR